jgi:hypothetical protein
MNESLHEEISYIYTKDSITQLLKNHSFKIVKLFSDFNYSDFIEKTSKRFVIIAKKY